MFSRASTLGKQINWVGRVEVPPQRVKYLTAPGQKTRRLTGYFQGGKGQGTEQDVGDGCEDDEEEDAEE